MNLPDADEGATDTAPQYPANFGSDLCSRAAPCVCGFWKISAHSTFKHTNQLGLHELVIVGYAQTDNPFAVQVGLEPCGHFSFVDTFHHENDVRPFNQLATQRNVSAGVYASRRALDARPFGKDLLGRGAAQPVLTANEQDTLHFMHEKAL
jgi:hypothetical protein